MKKATKSVLNIVLLSFGWCLRKEGASRALRAKSNNLRRPSTVSQSHSQLALSLLSKPAIGLMFRLRPSHRASAMLPVAVASLSAAALLALPANCPIRRRVSTSAISAARRAHHKTMAFTFARRCATNSIFVVWSKSQQFVHGRGEWNDWIIGQILSAAASFMISLSHSFLSLQIRSTFPHY